MAVGDDALGFWKAVKQMFSTTPEQRCWVHKSANVLDKLPKHLQPKAKAGEFLKKDRDELLTFYDFPAQHWTHLRTTEPIESTFAAVRLRQRKS